MKQNNNPHTFINFMRWAFVVALTAAFFTHAAACSTDNDENDLPQTTETMDQKLYLTINNQTTLTATLVSNSSTQALVNALKTADITYEAHDYGNFEKVGDLGITLPQNNEQITTQPGDLILYQGTNLCIYYDTNTWNFTCLGRIDDISTERLREVLGTGNVTVKLSLNSPTGEVTTIAITPAENKADDTNAYYTLSGQQTSQPQQGQIYIHNGKKIKY